MKDLLAENLIATFEREFKFYTISVQKVDVGNSKLHSVFIRNLNLEELRNDWIRITNLIAIEYQNNLESDYERWNLYLFFLLTDAKTVSDDLKYTIENNTFSSRKIIEDASLSDEVLIKKHVINELTIKKDKKRSIDTDFTYDTLIYTVLKDKKLKNKKILARPLEEAYNQLITKIKGNS